MIRPDYHGGSIVNLMASIEAALGGSNPFYPPLTQLPASSLAAARNVVLLVLDGLGHDYLNRAGAGGALHGQLQGRMTSVFPSTTASAITAFLTGLAPQQHALTGWHIYFREIGTVAAVLPFRPRLPGVALTESGVDLATLLAPRPLSGRLQLPVHVVSPARIVHSEFNRAYAGPAQRRGYDSLEQLFGTVAEIMRQGSGRQFIYAYYPELDALAHEHGIDSKPVAEEFARLDAAFGRFLAAIRGSDTALIVTADHGLIDSGPDRLIELSDHPALARTLVLPLCGERRAAYCYVHPSREDEFCSYVNEELSEYVTLRASTDLVDEGWFGLGTPDPRLLERIGHYTLVMKDNYAIKDWLPGERRHVHIGVHGGVSAGEMYVPLIVATA